MKKYFAQIKHVKRAGEIYKLALPKIYGRFYWRGREFLISNQLYLWPAVVIRFGDYYVCTDAKTGCSVGYASSIDPVDCACDAINILESDPELAFDGLKYNAKPLKKAKWFKK